MSVFEVPIIKVERVEDHPNADRLSLVYFREYVTISAKQDDGSHRYNIGDLVVYVPEGSVVPEYLLKKGFWDEKKGTGILAGSNGDRAKAIRLRGILSQGIMFPVTKTVINEEISHVIYNDNSQFLEVSEGSDVSEFLGIVKYEPPVPTQMAGDVAFIGLNRLPKFDVENIKKYPDVLIEGEEVIITEKLHGTCFGFAYIPGLNNPDVWDGDFVCFSKGLGSKGLVFKRNESNLSKNVYVKTFEKLFERFKRAVINQKETIVVYGEIYGRGIQDLHYGVNEPEVRLFEVSRLNMAVPASWDQVEYMADKLCVETVPVLYEGPWKKELRSLRDGNSSLFGHIREGIVIKPYPSRRDAEIGNVILKDVSDAYLTRKNATEYT